MTDTDKQYIDLFEQNLQLINQHSDPIINKERRDNLDRFIQLGGLPDFTHEDYLQTNLQRAFSEVDYGLNFSALNFPIKAETFHCGVKGIGSKVFLINNDVFSSPTTENYTAGEPLICSLKQAAKLLPDLVATHLGKAIKSSTDPATFLNAAFAQDGFFIYVPRGVKLPNVIQVINLMNATIDIMANSRNLIIIEPEAEAKVLVCAHTAGEHNYFAHRLTEVFVGESARYEHYKLESSSATMRNLGHLYIQQETSSEVLVNEVTLRNGHTRNNVQVDLNGHHASLTLAGMAVNDSDQRTDTHTLVRHLAPHCETRELYKYVLNDSAQGTFDGTIFVAPDAQKTVANQTNKNICLSHDARMFAKPHLVINADDVICNHGATVGQLDDEALFYMQQRGIPQEEARMLLMLAFLDDVEQEIRVPALRDSIRNMIERRFRGNHTRCEGCGGC